MGLIWDNILILQTVDRLQAASGGAELWHYDGSRLMEEIQGSRVNEYQAAAGFLQELRIAEAGGLIGFREDVFPGGAPYSGSDPLQHLQRLRRFALTVPGQDRARGQRIVEPTPDPSDDDGRPIATSVLRMAARALADEYEGPALADFFNDAGIPLGLSPIADVAHDNPDAILQGLYAGGSEGRRILRSFLGRWLDGQLLDDPPEPIRRQLVERLGRQGWFARDGSLAIGEPVGRLSGASPVFLDARLDALHPRVKAVTERLVRSDSGEAAVLEALKTVNDRLRELSGVDRDGQALVNFVLGGNKPLLLLTDTSTETGRNIQEGYRAVFAGVMQALRNPRAHELFADISHEELFEQLGLASLLMRQLDEARLVAPTM